MPCPVRSRPWPPMAPQARAAPSGMFTLSARSSRPVAHRGAIVGGIWPCPRAPSLRWRRISTIGQENRLSALGFARLLQGGGDKESFFRSFAICCTVPRVKSERTRNAGSATNPRKSCASGRRIAWKGIYYGCAFKVRPSNPHPEKAGKRRFHRCTIARKAGQFPLQSESERLRWPASPHATFPHFHPHSHALSLVFP
jgi:hypothetical protein